MTRWNPLVLWVGILAAYLEPLCAVQQYQYSHSARQVVFDLASKEAFVSSVVQVANQPSSNGTTCLFASLSLSQWTWTHAEMLSHPAQHCPPIALWNQDQSVVVTTGSTASSDTISGTQHLHFDELPMDHAQSWDLTTLNVTHAVHVPQRVLATPQWVAVASFDTIEDSGTSTTEVAKPLESTSLDEFHFPDYWTASVKVSISVYHSLAVNDAISQQAHSDWTQRIATVSNKMASHPRKIHLTNLLWQPAMTYGSIVFIAGSTYQEDGDLVQGFWAAWNATSGRPMLQQEQSMTWTLLRYEGSEQDWVTGICVDPTTSQQTWNANSLFLVGATTASTTDNTDSIQAFVKKIDWTDGRVVWSVQLESIHVRNPSQPSQAFAMACQIQDGKNLYVTGGVQDGAAMMESPHRRKESQGGDDVWVASLDARFGTIHHLDQLGSRGDDHLAADGSLILDHHGNVVLLGDTTGTIMPDKDEMEETTDPTISNLFVLDIREQDGSYHVISSQHESFPGSNQTIDSIPDDATLPPLTHQERPTTTNGTTTPFHTRHGAFLALIFLVAIVVGFYMRRKPRRDRNGTRSSTIYDYLRPMNVGTVDIQVGRSGGWNVAFSDDIPTEKRPYFDAPECELTQSPTRKSKFGFSTVNTEYFANYVDDVRPNANGPLEEEDSPGII